MGGIYLHCTVSRKLVNFCNSKVPSIGFKQTFLCPIDVANLIC